MSHSTLSAARFGPSATQTTSRLARAVLIIGAFATMAAACSSDGSELVISSPDGGAGSTVVYNADIRTGDPNLPAADAFAYGPFGTIIAVGTKDEVFEAAGEDPRTINAGGRLVLPGFQDVHVHVPEAGLNLDVCYFPSEQPLDEYEALAVECAESQADADWVRAAGASLFDLRQTDETPLEVLDRAIPDRPALVLDDLGHAAWTNTLGLEAAGITNDSPDPAGGVLHRDASGQLTGLLLENAQHLVRDAATPDEETIYQALLTSLDELAANGITTVSDAGGYWAEGHPAAWQRAQSEGALTVRAFNTLYLYPDLDLDEQLATFHELSAEGSPFLRFDTAKVYVDGILDLGTALLVDPYDVPVDEDYPSGFEYFGESQLATVASELHAQGYRINFHAIGDGAVRQALDVVEGLPDTPEAIAERRHRITHTYLVHHDDLGRFADIGVIPDFQQSPDAISGDYMNYLTEFIGDRAFDLIPTAELIDTGITVTLSSDWDAGPLSPLGTIERAITRDTNAVPSLEKAIGMHTIDAAYALGHAQQTGSISVDKFADFIILDTNLFDIEPTEIDEAEVVLTVVNGDIVYEADDT